jgi:DtxR family transcriptional regulator, Mn-dependent transcriptional regulator
MVSRASQNYLRAIFSLMESKGYARVKDISSAMGVRPASVSEMLGKLRLAGFVNYEKHGGIALTAEGRRLASGLHTRYLAFLRLFELAGVPTKAAFRDACALEHYVSEETCAKLTVFLDGLPALPRVREPDSFRGRQKSSGF